MVIHCIIHYAAAAASLVLVRHCKHPLNQQAQKLHQLAVARLIYFSQERTQQGFSFYSRKRTQVWFSMKKPC